MGKMRTKLDPAVSLATVVMILGCGPTAHAQVNRPSHRLVRSAAEGEAWVAPVPARRGEQGELGQQSRHSHQSDEAVLPEHCAAAERFLVADRGMVAVAEPDTIEDVRTRRTLPGCRVTAAGITSTGLAAEAERFYRRLRAAGWERTPNPIDAPNEASLRFRMGESDCLFNVYSGGLLGTPAEIEVSTAVVPRLGETRYNVLVLCTPALDAAPRSEPLQDRASGRGDIARKRAIVKQRYV